MTCSKCEEVFGEGVDLCNEAAPPRPKRKELKERIKVLEENLDTYKHLVENKNSTIKHLDEKYDSLVKLVEGVGFKVMKYGIVFLDKD